MSRVKNAKRNIIWEIISKIIHVLIPFAIRTLLIMYLGKSYLGLDSLFNSILQMLNIAELGFGSAVVYNMYKPVAEGRTEDICALLNLYRKAYRIIGCIVSGIGLIIIPILPRLIKSDLPADVNLYFLYLIFLLNTTLGYWLFAYKKSLLAAFQRADIVSKLTTCVFIIKTGLQILTLFLIRKYIAYIIIMPVATIAENLAAEVITRKYYPEYRPIGKVSSDIYSDVKLRIKGLMIRQVCNTSRNSMDNIIISAYLGLDMVAVYGNYYSIMAAVHKTMNGVLMSILGVVGNAVAKKTHESNYNDMLLFNFIYMWLAALSFICMLCLYQPFMKIWMGDDMLLTGRAMLLIAIYFYSLCMGDVRSVYYNACGLWWEGRYRSAAEALSNIILNIVLCKFFGIYGVIIATIFSILIINFGYGTTIIHKHYFKGISPIPFYKQHAFHAAITFVAAAACYALCSLIHTGGITGLLIRVLICLTVSNLIMLVSYFRKPVFNDAYRFVLKLIGKG